MEKKMTLKTSKADRFKNLTWDDLEEWAGSRVLSRGQSYQRSHRVQELAQTKSGELVAWVQGEKRYATQVDFKGGELTSTCTCPYRGACKHAVAVVLEYLDHLRKSLEIPQITRQDPRIELLLGFTDDEDIEDDEDKDKGDQGRQEVALGSGRRSGLFK
jgi:uncharacterized Zn finger protein